MADQPHRGERGTCSSCGRAVVWVETELGTRVLDAEPERRFVIVNQMKARLRNTYQSHTCGDADRWRKERDDG